MDNQNTISGTLYIVATPIGNLSDITLRAIETLKNVDVIACEDTRNSRVLCQHHSITTPLIAYHEHNADTMLPTLQARLEKGEIIALISDAGTPLISDPGYRLVTALSQAGITITPIPGASSVITALSAGGLPTDCFHYAGFLSSKQQARRTQLEALQPVDATLVLLESSHRLLDTLADAHAILGDRDAVIAREMTKKFEEFNRASLSELLEDYQARPKVKGEIVLLIAPPKQPEPDIAQATPLLEALIPHYPLKAVCALIADATGLNKKALYQQALTLKDNDNG